MPLTREQNIELSALVEERRRLLLRALREDVARTRGEQYKEIAGPAPDAGDESVASLIADLEQADVARDLDELRSFEAAHDRIADGKYGICVDCGNDIEYRRLRVNPSALRCIDCQRKHEKTHAGTTGSSL